MRRLLRIYKKAAVTVCITVCVTGGACTVEVVATVWTEVCVTVEV
jgi:hypothetical protein